MELKQAQYLFEQFFPDGKVEHLQAITEGLINQTFVVFTTLSEIYFAVNKHYCFPSV